MQQKKKITLLEDNDDYREVITSILESAGYEIFAASVGYEIFKNMATESPDLILMDIMLPGITGDKVVNSFKKNNLLGEVPVIVISSKDIDEIKEVAESVGAVAYMQKPLDKEELLSLVEKYS